MKLFKHFLNILIFSFKTKIFNTLLQMVRLTSEIIYNNQISKHHKNRKIVSDVYKINRKL